jgi:hypothetical protein
VEATITPAGGVMRLGDNSVVFPPGAVKATQVFRMRKLGSADDRIRLRAIGYDHYQFAVPVVVTLSYANCSGLPSTPLTAWYVNDVTGLYAQVMGGFDNKLARTVTFLTNHFSTYALSGAGPQPGDPCDPETYQGPYRCEQTGDGIDSGWTVVE